MHLKHLTSILSLATIPALASDALTREFCACGDGWGRVGYKRIVSYVNGREGVTSHANDDCIGGGLPQCDLDVFYVYGVRSCSDDKRFCYDAEVTSKDKYSWDGKEASLDDAGEPETDGLFGCDTLCGTLGDGFKSQGFAQNEAYYNIQPGL